MKPHSIPWLSRLFAAITLLLAVACSKDEATVVQLPMPETLRATPTAHSLLLEWDAVENASQYELQANNEAGYTFETTVSENRYEIMELAPYTEYAVRVRAIVQADNFSNSEWSAWTTFRTLDLTVAEEFAGGSGTQEDPYLIERPSHLALLARAVNEQQTGYFEPGVCYRLTADLDLTDYDWTPIGAGPDDGRYPYENPVRAFQGVFDGDGHTISNLKVNLTGETTFTSAGLFGVNDGTIRNLNVSGTVSAATTSTEKSQVFAGGIAGFNIIAYEDSMNTRPGSGAIEQCTFQGSVSASCGSDRQGEADAGGIVGMAESGNIDYCGVTLADEDAVTATGGTTSMTGGIAGAMNGGRITHSTLSGSGALRTLFNGIPEGYYVYAQTGGIVGSTADATVENCTVEFSGTMEIPEGGPANCNAGGIAGNSGSSITDGVALLSGDISIHSGGTINFGAVVGSLAGSGSGSVTLARSEWNGTLEIEQTDNYSDVNVGGIYGVSASAVVSASEAKIGASLDITSQVSDGTTNVNIGGVAGTGSVLTAGCSAEWSEAARVKVTSDRTNYGGVAGLVQSADNYAFLIACYAHCAGAVEIAPNTGTDYVANAGGVAGNFSGYSMIWPYPMDIPAFMEGCYALVETDFTIRDGAGKGIAGLSEAATLSGVFWGSRKGSVTEDLTGAQPFASLDRSGFEAAIEAMNTAIANSAMSSLVQASYTYDAERNCPVLAGAQ